MWVFSLLSVAVLGILLLSSISAQAQGTNIEGLVTGKSASEKADIKGIEIAKFNHKGKFTKGNLEIEIQSLENIRGGVEVFARGWKDGRQLGFGKDGSVEIERFRIFNPPVLVSDPNGAVIRKFENPVTHEITTLTYREDPVEAIRQVMAHNISLVGKKNTKIVQGKIGNTTDTYYPDADAESTSVDGMVTRTNVSSWSDARNDANGNNVHDATTQSDIAAEEEFTNNFSITRAFFLFDTSAISDSDIIRSATFSVYVTAGEGNDRTFGLIQTNPSSNTSLSVGDFDALTLNSPAEGAARVSLATTSAYSDFVLNSTGLGWVSKSSVTKLGLRHQDDIDNTQPSTGRQYAGMRFADQTGTTEDPKLVVVHESNAAPSAPTSLLTEGQSNPTEVVDTTPEFSAIYNDSDSGDQATHYRIQVSTVSNFSSTYWDSGTTTIASLTAGARSQEIAYGGSALATSTTYYWRIKFSDDDGAEGAWSTESATFVVTDAQVLKMRKAFNESVQNSSTLQNDDSLALVLGANRTYIIDGVIFVSSGSAVPDLKIGFSVPSGATTSMAYMNDESRGVLATGDTSQGISLPGSSTQVPVHFSGTVVTASTAGDMILRWAQDSSNSNVTTIHAGSYIRADEI